MLQRLPPSAFVQPRAPRPSAGLITVVVPMYEAGEWIDVCLKSLLAQRHADIEIFCIDDCSRDDSYGRVVEQFGRDRRLCAVRLGQNVGPYQIKNWVIGSLARGALVALQDADDVSHPARLGEQRRWMRRHGFRIAGTSVHQFYPRHLAPAVRGAGHTEVEGTAHDIAFYASVDRVERPAAMLDVLRNRDGFQFSGPGGVGYASNHASVACYATQLLERSLFLEFGGYDGHTKIGADRDFNWRVLRFHDVGNVARVLYSRRLHERSLTEHPLTGYGSPARRQYAFARNDHHENVRRALLAGDLHRVRELCTADVFHADIMVEEAHTGFDVDLAAR